MSSRAITAPPNTGLGCPYGRGALEADDQLQVKIAEKGERSTNPALLLAARISLESCITCQGQPDLADLSGDAICSFAMDLTQYPYISKQLKEA